MASREPSHTASDALDFTITGHLDGCCIRFGGEVVGVFDSHHDAKNALNAARRLAEVLNRKDA